MAKTINLGKVGLTFEGDYDSSKNYASRTCVFYNHVSWTSKKDVPAGIAPGTNDEYWQKVSERGAQGIQGERGPQGNSAFDGNGVEIVNDLTTGGEAAVLSAEQGKILKTELTELESEVNSISGSEGIIEQTLSAAEYPQINISRNYKPGDVIRVEVLTPIDLRIGHLYEMSADGKDVIVQHFINATSGMMEISENYQGKIRILFAALSSSTQVSVSVTNEGALKVVESKVESKVETLESDVETLESDVETLESDVETLESDVETLDGKVGTLESTLLGGEEIVEKNLSAETYPQINLSRDYKPGDEIVFNVISPNDLIILNLFEIADNGVDVVAQHKINATSGEMTISENYQGRIRVLFNPLYSPTKASVKLTLKGELEVLGSKIETLESDVETLESDVETLERVLLGGEEILEQTLQAGSYPQINFSKDYESGDVVRFEVLSPSDLIIAYLYEMSEDGKTVVVQHPIDATSGEMTISENYQGRIRILFPLLSSDTKTSVKLTNLGKAGALEDKVESLEDKVESLEDKVELSKQQIPYMNSLRIIKRVGCIGDSYTQGHIQLKGQAAELKKDYSWPFFLSQITGNTYSNWGVGGSTAKDWMNSIISVVDEPGNKCQAYIIGLGINDGSSWSSTATRPGESSDIGTDNDVYIAYYYKIVQRCLSVNPLAKILCLTMPNRGEDYNAAVRGVVSHCNENGQNNVLLVDLAQDKYAKSENFYKNPYYLSDASEGHYTAIGYEFMAECFYIILSDIIKNNISEFQNIHQIPYDE